MSYVTLVHGEVNGFPDTASIIYKHVSTATYPFIGQAKINLHVDKACSASDFLLGKPCLLASYYYYALGALNTHAICPFIKHYTIVIPYNLVICLPYTVK